MAVVDALLEQRLGSLNLPLALVLARRAADRRGRRRRHAAPEGPGAARLDRVRPDRQGRPGLRRGPGRLRRQHARPDGRRLPDDRRRPDPARRSARRSSGGATSPTRRRSQARHSARADARQVQFHYDVSDDFYALWLDPRRLYSCAYFRDPAMTLAQAQEAKLDHICRKLMLRAGERFLDIGAGWGGLLLWAAENYGVRAQGITLSKNQHAHVNRLIDERGLAAACTMELLDYRDLPEDEPYDKIASVGMFEHVGRAQPADLLREDPAPAQAGRAAAEPRHHRRRHAQPPARRRARRLHRALHLPGRRAAARLARCCARWARPASSRSTSRTCARTTRRTLWAWSDALEAQPRRGAQRCHARDASCAPTGSTSPAARCASSTAGCRCSRCWRRGPAATSRRADARRTIAFPFNRGYMYAPTLRPDPMMYDSSRKAAGDLIMMGPAGDTVLRIIGREPAARASSRPAALPAAIAALEQAIAADEPARASAREADDDRATRVGAARQASACASAPGRWSR